MSSGKDNAEAVFVAWATSAQEHGAELGAGHRHGEYLVTLPGEQKLRTTVSVLIGARSFSATAFVIRRPDENAESFYTSLLRRNARMPGVSYAIDASGDVFVTGWLPTAGVTERTVDDVMGAILHASDGVFNDLLALGFLSSMKREWAWRISRGESTRNLDAFKHLLVGDDEPVPTSPARTPDTRDCPEV